MRFYRNVPINRLPIFGFMMFKETEVGSPISAARSLQKNHFTLRLVRGAQIIQKLWTTSKFYAQKENKVDTEESRV
jgi:hypothetical protein